MSLNISAKNGCIQMPAEKADTLTSIVLARSIYLGEIRLYILDDVHARVFTSAKI
jgi:hypothetical protein